MRKTLLAAALLAFTTPAFAINFDFGGEVFATNATTDTLTVAGPIPIGNQPQNIQCIICGTHQPQQDLTFGYNNYKQGGNITTFLTSSTAELGGVQLDNNTLGTGYTKLFLLAFLAAQNSFTFNIGVDVNTATGAGPEILERFAVVDLANRIILADTGQIHMSLPTLNNGTGFPDYTISGFDLNRGDILPGANIVFLAQWSNTSDGAESFFIVPQAVPGPVAGAGIPGLVIACGALWGFARRRRQLAA
jgi:hypothetical protein